MWASLRAVEAHAGWRVWRVGVMHICVASVCDRFLYGPKSRERFLCIRVCARTGARVCVKRVRVGVREVAGFACRQAERTDIWFVIERNLCSSTGEELKGFCASAMCADRAIRTVVQPPRTELTAAVVTA